MISECELSSVEIVGPPSCDTKCDTGCPSDICFTESSGAWTDGPVCSNGTSICCCEEDCSDYHAEILSEYTGIDKDLIKYVIGGGGIAFIALLYRLKKQITPNNNNNENGITHNNSHLTMNCCCGSPLEKRKAKSLQQGPLNKEEEMEDKIGVSLAEPDNKEENIMP
tara:strand:+ start:2208 stop:2708 length:501 start_codon:yes stop_codon:yes gene_type:complete